MEQKPNIGSTDVQTWVKLNTPTTIGRGIKYANYYNLTEMIMYLYLHITFKWSK